MDKKVNYKFWVFIFVLNFILSCEKEFEVPIHYNGFAILQTKDLPDDGGDLFTFYFLPELKNEHLIQEMNFSQEISGKSITFIFPQGNEYTDYKIKLNATGWDKYDDDFIFVKVNYDILIADWKDYTNIRLKKINIGNKDFEIKNYDFYNLVNNKGEALYKINDIKFISKVN